MTYYNPFLAWAVVTAALIMLYVTFTFGVHQNRCQLCGGKGEHDRDCPFTR